jgi:TolC family type I secretion outer membrane protein
MGLLKLLKKLFILLLFFVFLSADKGYAQEVTLETPVVLNSTLTLSECIDIALENNPAIQSYFFNTGIYKSRIGQARSAYFPQIDLEASYDRFNSAIDNDFFDTNNNNFFTGVSLNQLIYDFGRTPTNIKINKINYNASTEDLKNQIRQVVFDVKQNYYLVLLKIQTRNVFEEAILLYEQQLKQAQALYEAGFKAKIDVITAEVNLNNAKLDLITAQNDLEASIEYLNNVMGLPGFDGYALSGELKYIDYAVDFEEMINKAYAQRPDLQSVKLSKDSAIQSKRYAKKEYLPTIRGKSAFGARGDNSMDPSWSVGAVFSVPVFNGLLTHNKIKEAKATVKKRHADIETLKQSIYLEVKEIYLNFTETKQRIPLTELVVDQAEERLRLAEKRYQIGAGNIIEVKDAEIGLINAKLSYLENLYQYNIAVFNLQKATGTDIPNIINIF